MAAAHRRALSPAPVLVLALVGVVGNVAVAAGQSMVGSRHTHVVTPGESMPTVAAGHGMRVDYLASLNDRRESATLAAGTVLQVDDRHLVAARLPDGVVVNVAQRLLLLVEKGEVSRAFPVAAGRPTWQTPRGTFRVVAREIDPVWDVPRSIRDELRQRGQPAPLRVLPGPRNPLGDRWLGLDAFDIGIHGTNAPGSIYQLVTHGCIRLQPAHVRELYDLVPLGTIVTVLYEPVLTMQDGDGWWLEVHPDRYRLAGDLTAAAVALLREAGLVVDAQARQQIERIVTRASGRPELVVRTEPATWYDPSSGVVGAAMQAVQAIGVAVRSLRD